MGWADGPDLPMNGASSPPATSAPQMVTTTTAMRRLGGNREQVARLIDCRLLRVTGTYGRARLLEPSGLEDLAQRSVLADAGNPADLAASSDVLPYALAVHLGPRNHDTNRFNERAWLGWDADLSNPDEAWTGWWATGERIADECAAAGLPILPAVSGFVVDARIVLGWTPHPVYPGLVRFQVSPPDPTTALGAIAGRYQKARFRPAAGPPWQRLWHRSDPAAPLAVADDLHALRT